VATVYALLKSHWLEGEIKVNIEQNHALLAGHTFEHEISLAQALGIFGSIDMNRGDEQLGWDTDQFPNNLPQVALALYHILKGGGFTTGGLNFDAKLRRQSIDPIDLVEAHAGAMDLCARALLVAEKMIRSDTLGAHVEQRYAGWGGKLGKGILAGRQSLADLAALVDQTGLDPQPRSGRQEHLERLVNSCI
jgi:xylose isomerase